MFHIFYMNQGFMLMLEPPTLGSIFDLQRCIQHQTGVDVPDQFLFLSGGVSLASDAMLASIPGAGTDTNPIFLVKRITNVQSTPIKENADGINNLYQGWNAGIERLDKSSSNSPGTTIAECINMGKMSASVAEMVVRFCANVISEHQYLHQGWLAVIANLDDNINRIQRRLDKASVQGEKLEEIRTKGRQLLADFDNVVGTLSKIIIPPTLLSPSASTANLTESDDSGGEEISLYDWISSKDDQHSFESLSSHILDHLEKTDNSDLRDALAFFSMVREVAQKTQYRDINGIDKRLATLNAKLQNAEKWLMYVRDVSTRVVQPLIQDQTAQNVAIWQKQRLDELREPLKNLHECAVSFILSKEEVVKNISQRFSTWIRQAYQRLHEANKRMVIFEEKFTGLRQRLDLARQIKETPDIYMASVPEVIRREELKKEFSSWISAYIDRTTAFINEENRIREQFNTKLERHFLRQLFTGMDDKIPRFSPETPPKIDLNLPLVPVAHLAELRKIFPQMRDLLTIGAPHVYQRLAVADWKMMNQSQLFHREQSFYDRDRTSNMDALNRNFPSTNWLSDQNMEISPSIGPNNYHLPMTRGGQFTSSTSLHSLGSTTNMDLQSPQELATMASLGDHQQQPPYFSTGTITTPVEPIGEQQQLDSNKSNRSSMSPLQPSAPIAVPTAANNFHHKDAIESIGSNHFSTPEEFSSFGSDAGRTSANRLLSGGGDIRCTFPNQPMFRCSPKITRPLSLLRAQQASQPVLFEEADPTEYKQQQQTQTDVVVHLTPIAEAKLTNAQNQLRELAQNVVSLRQFCMELSQIGPNFSSLKSPDELKQLIEEVIKEKVRATVDEVRAGVEKDRDECLQEMKAKYEAQIEEQQANFKQKSLEQQSEIDLLKEKLELMTKEKDELLLNAAALAKQQEEEQQKQSTSMSQMMEKEDENASTLAANVASREMAAMTVSCSVIEVGEECNIASQHGSDEDEGIVKLCSRSCGVQTKLRQKDMKAFVSLNEIYEGLGSLIIWNAQMNAFMAHCTNPKALPYIVKETSLERLGIRRSRPKEENADEATSSSSNAAPPQRTWAFVVVESIEPCQIRKASNRYNLPLNSRFFRIAVKQMPGEFGSSISSTSSIASSRR